MLGLPIKESTLFPHERCPFSQRNERCHVKSCLGKVQHVSQRERARASKKRALNGAERRAIDWGLSKRDTSCERSTGTHISVETGNAKVYPPNTRRNLENKTPHLETASAAVCAESRDDPIVFRGRFWNASATRKRRKRCRVQKRVRTSACSSSPSIQSYPFTKKDTDFSSAAGEL